MLTDQERAKFKDSFGVYDKVNGDGGDSCAYSCSIISVEAMQNGGFHPDLLLSTTTIRQFQPAPGIIIRHPDKERDASDWDRGSRDQELPFIVAAGILSPPTFDDYLSGSKKRFFLTTTNIRHNGANKHNHGEEYSPGKRRDYAPKRPDFTGPEHWAAILRGKRAWYLFFIVWALDIFTFLSACHIRFSGKEIKADGKLGWKKDIVMNHNLRALYGIFRIWSPFCALAIWVNGQDNLSERMDQHFRLFNNHFDFFGREHKLAYERIKERSLINRFFCKY